MRRVILSALVCVPVMTMAAAQSADAPAGADKARIEGSWKFQTEPYREGTCVLSGTMQIRPTETADQYNCQFTAIEDCQGQDRWVVQQTCEAARKDGRLSITSSITGFIEAEAITDAYQTDNFVLQITSSSVMDGWLVSAISAPVAFYRALDIVS